MNVIEAAEKAGWSELGADLWGATFDGAITKDALERFAQIIRNQALEEAAKCCDDLRSPWGYSAEKADWIRGTDDCAHSIRAMKKESL